MIARRTERVLEPLAGKRAPQITMAGLGGAGSGGLMWLETTTEVKDLWLWPGSGWVNAVPATTAVAPVQRAWQTAADMASAAPSPTSQWADEETVMPRATAMSLLMAAAATPGAVKAAANASAAKRTYSLRHKRTMSRE